MRVVFGVLFILLSLNVKAENIPWDYAKMDNYFGNDSNKLNFYQREVPKSGQFYAEFPYICPASLNGGELRAVRFYPELIEARVADDGTPYVQASFNRPKDAFANVLNSSNWDIGIDEGVPPTKLQVQVEGLFVPAVLKLNVLCDYPYCEGGGCSIRKYDLYALNLVDRKPDIHIMDVRLSGELVTSDGGNGYVIDYDPNDFERSTALSLKFNVAGNPNWEDTLGWGVSWNVQIGDYLNTRSINARDLFAQKTIEQSIDLDLRNGTFDGVNEIVISVTDIPMDHDLGNNVIRIPIRIGKVPEKPKGKLSVSSIKLAQSVYNPFQISGTLYRQWADVFNDPTTNFTAVKGKSASFEIVLERTGSFPSGDASTYQVIMFLTPI